MESLQTRVLRLLLLSETDNSYRVWRSGERAAGTGFDVLPDRGRDFAAVLAQTSLDQLILVFYTHIQPNRDGASATK
jgi:hypothetical protein